MWYLLFKHVLIGPILRILGRPTAVGMDNLPTTGPVILAGNHLTVVDSFFLVLLCPPAILCSLSLSLSSFVHLCSPLISLLTS